MLRPVILYGLTLALAALALEWLHYRYAVRALSPELYVGLIALAFTAVGIWTGNRLTRRHPPLPFAPNLQALDTLGISARERDVLALLAEGHSNKDIARRLGISPNTVKTHVARVFEKLEVTRRTQAIHKARALEILP